MHVLRKIFIALCVAAVTALCFARLSAISEANRTTSVRAYSSE